MLNQESSWSSWTIKYPKRCPCSLTQSTGCPCSLTQSTGHPCLSIKLGCSWNCSLVQVCVFLKLSMFLLPLVPPCASLPCHPASEPSVQLALIPNDPVLWPQLCFNSSAKGNGPSAQIFRRQACTPRLHLVFSVSQICDSFMKKNKHCAALSRSSHSAVYRHHGSVGWLWNMF